MTPPLPITRHPEHPKPSLGEAEDGEGSALLSLRVSRREFIVLQLLRSRAITAILLLSLYALGVLCG